MKLEIYLWGIKRGGNKEWACHLPLDGAICCGLGSSPIEAYNDYLLDILETYPNSIDGVWCKERGLLK